uniref:Uncharacterized protein n=1 Tax=Peronospora matthiolae TaxID=2874970 RepID=A0AAV1T939_9STRA
MEGWPPTGSFDEAEWDVDRSGNDSSHDKERPHTRDDRCRLQRWQSRQRGHAGLAEAYKVFETEHNRALWEATPCLCISQDQAHTISFLASYYSARKKRRSKAYLAWREIVGQIFAGMAVHRCDVDIFLDHFFRHLPRPRRAVYWFPGCEEGSDSFDLLAALHL